MDQSRHAVVIGATGLIGEQLVQCLLEDEYFQTVKVIVRRPIDISHSKLESVLVEDFDLLDNYAEELSGTHFFCALGTTMKQAGSKEAFRKVDYDYPLKFAQLAKKQSSFRHMLVVSATGANASSFIFYNQVKGELEETLVQLGLDHLTIFQPSLLLGDRQDSRLGEQLGAAFFKFLSFFRFGTRKMIGCIYSSDVAKAMAEVAKRDAEGTHRLNSDEMVEVVYQ